VYDVYTAPVFSESFLYRSWEKIGDILKSTNQSPDAFDDFAKEAKAMDLLKKQYRFFIALLEGDEDLTTKYKDEIGEAYYTERLVEAASRCVDILDTFKKTLRYKTDNYLSTIQSRPEAAYAMPFSSSYTECERLGMCICEDIQKPPYILSCIPVAALKMTKLQERERMKKAQEKLEAIK
jgi:hypothetical protein